MILLHTLMLYIFNGIDFLAVITSSHKIEPEEQLKKGIKSFDLDNCTNVL